MVFTRLSIIETIRLRVIRRRVRDGDIGGELDGILTTHELNWLAFWKWCREREPERTLADLSPEREQELFDNIMREIRDDE